MKDFFIGNNRHHKHHQRVKSSVVKVTALPIQPLVLTRRQLLWLGFGGVGLGGALLIDKLSPEIATSSVPIKALPVPQSPVFQTFEFDVITVNAKGQVKSRKRRQAQSFTEELSDGVGLEMVAIPGDSFIMGSPKSEAGLRDSDEAQYSVTVSGFFMGKYEVTQAQWKAIAALPQVNVALDADPSKFKGAKRPVEQVNWFEAVEFCDRLSRKTGRQFRLPSEAEWEYACRAGTTTPFYFGETLTTDLANYRGTDWEKYQWSGSYGQGPKGIFRGQTTNVGSFLPNAFGLYDLHGNVLEWCLDHWHDSYEGAPNDGSAWITGGTSKYRLVRGGSWSANPGICRSASRGGFEPDFRNFNFGFRVVCSSVAPA